MGLLALAPSLGATPLMPSPVAPQEVGSALGKVALDDLAGTEATSFDDFYGRLVLLEFFAYW